MDRLKKIVMLIMIQTFFLSNFCFAQQLERSSGTLSPRIMIANDILMNTFSLDKKIENRFILEVLKDYDPRILILADGRLSLAGRGLVELRIIIHELGSYLTPVFAWPVSSAEQASIDKNDLKKIREMSEKLKLFYNTLVAGFLNNGFPSLENLNDIIMQANGLRTKSADLKAMRDKGQLSDNYSFILKNGISSIDFIIEHVDAALFGAEEVEFDIRELLKKEETNEILDAQSLINPVIFGYRGGLNFVIKNLRYNVFDHSGPESKYYDVKLGQDEKNTTIIFADRGVGFDIETIKQGAVEFGFWEQAYADIASEAEIIDLIFAEGFSSRYEKGSAHGLGLWLCRQVIEKYFKGTITAENAQGNPGAVFKITIPRIKKRSLGFELRTLRAFSLGTALLVVPLSLGMIYSKTIEQPRNGQSVLNLKKTTEMILQQRIKTLLNPAVKINRQFSIEQSI